MLAVHRLTADGLGAADREIVAISALAIYSRSPSASFSLGGEVKVRVDINVPFLIRLGLVRYEYRSYAVILCGKLTVFCRLASP